MNKELLTGSKDPMGAAIYDYFINRKADRIRVFSSMFDEDEICVKDLFRSYGAMPSLEQKAIKLAKGHILDVGAGSGCHSLSLQELGKKVTAIDISPLSVEVMQKRGVDDVQLLNFFDDRFIGQFDTILMLMNGSGIVGRVTNLPDFFYRLDSILSPDGFVLMDTSDLRYLYENEDGSYDLDLNADYYGEVDFTMQYKEVKGECFMWLYLDFQTLSFYAEKAGYKVEIIEEGAHYDYLAKISKK